MSLEDIVESDVDADISVVRVEALCELEVDVEILVHDHVQTDTCAHMEPRGVAGVEEVLEVIVGARRLA